MAVSELHEFFIDPSRCIGCNSCVQACGECDTHKGLSMIQVDWIDPAASLQTVPLVCMHCESPTCAEVCPADAIKRTADGIVHSARKPRCIACNNCVLACPFGIPKMDSDMHLQLKCDMCYDRSSVGLKPMCASVCPSQALYFGTRAEAERLRPNSSPIRVFRFGNQVIKTKVNLMLPKAAPVGEVDVLSALRDRPASPDLEADLFSDSTLAEELTNV